MGIVNESGEPMLSLRTIVRAMGVLDDYTKTAEPSASPSSKVLHAYGLVERAVSGKHAYARQLSQVPLGVGVDIDGPA